MKLDKLLEDIEPRQQAINLMEIAILIWIIIDFVCFYNDQVHRNKIRP